MSGISSLQPDLGDERSQFSLRRSQFVDTSAPEPMPPTRWLRAAHLQNALLSSRHTSLRLSVDRVFLRHPDKQNCHEKQLHISGPHRVIRFTADSFHR
jgi:hypothetical protein